MKLSFTTAGCPGWSWNEIFATAKDLGMAGIELRGIGDTVFAPAIVQFVGPQLEITKKQLADGKMEICALDSTASLALPDCADAAMIEARAYIDLAAALGTKYVRVLATPNAAPSPADLTLCEKQYRLLCEYGAKKKVVPLMETNGVFADSSMLAQFLARVDHANSGVLWDIHHPYRFFGESPEVTVGHLGPYIRHTHVKDSLMQNGVLTYKMMGYGDVPIAGAVAALHKLGYTGYISLEWLKRWNPTLQEPGIVFAHFASYMEYVLGESVQ